MISKFWAFQRNRHEVFGLCTNENWVVGQVGQSVGRSVDRPFPHQRFCTATARRGLVRNHVGDIETHTRARAISVNAEVFWGLASSFSKRMRGVPRKKVRLNLGFGSKVEATAAVVGLVGGVLILVCI